MRRAAIHSVRLACLNAVMCGVLATSACATSPGDSDQATVQPTLEILALSRGRGVPDATSDALQAIASAAETARESKSVASITRQIIGLEGETRLCIVFRDQSALTAFHDEMSDLVADVDLLQMRVNNENCSETSGGEP